MVIDNKSYPSIYAVSVFMKGKDYGFIVMTSNANEIAKLICKQLNYIKEDITPDDFTFSAQQLLLKEGECRMI